MSTNKYDNKFNKKFAQLRFAISRHEQNISIIVNDFLTSPERSQKYWNSIKVRLDKEYKAIAALNREWAFTEIPRQYRFVLREQMAKAKKLKSISNQAKKSITQLLKSQNIRQIQFVLAQSAFDDIAGGLAMGRRDLGRVIAMTRQTLLTENLIDTSLMREIERGNIATSKILSRRGTMANRLMKAAEDGRHLTIINKNGQSMRYRITDYSELVYRTKWHDTQSAAVVTNNQNWDTDLIQVSNHNTSTEICQQYEGKIFSLTGKNKDFPVADQTPAFHPNCLHYISTTFEESLQVQGTYDAYSKFSKDKINRPPNKDSFIPVKKRNEIISKTTNDLKKTDAYINARPRRKYRMLREKIGKALGAAA